MFCQCVSGNKIILEIKNFVLNVIKIVRNISGVIEKKDPSPVFFLEEIIR